jgi:hypothetical protein
MDEGMKQHSRTPQTSKTKTSKPAVSATEIKASNTADSGDGAVEITNAKARVSMTVVKQQQIKKQVAVEAGTVGRGRNPDRERYLRRIGNNMKVEKITPAANSWLEVDKNGLRQTLKRKGISWAILELAQNSWDEDSTRVDITLTKPVNGKSTLTCRDNAPKGYANLSTSFVMFAPSYKKEDADKRGRFNIGEKLVLALCHEASITSTSGQVLFEADGKRRLTKNKTKAGSEFRGVLDVTVEEYADVEKVVNQILCPTNAVTTFNGQQITLRKPLRKFSAVLPTEIADSRGVPRKRDRQTEIRLCKVLDGELPTIYEKGLPIVELAGGIKWHVDIQQKVPLSYDRDNITPAYARDVYTIVLKEMVDYIEDEKEAAAVWVRTAVGNTNQIDKETVDKVMTKRYTEKRASVDPGDKGSKNEAASKGFTVVHGGSLTKEEWESVRKHKSMPTTREVAPTDYNCAIPSKVYKPEEYTPAMKRYEQLIVELSPILIHRKVTVSFIEDSDVGFQGCTKRWKPDSYNFEVNLAFHNVDDWQENYELLLHEMAHHREQSNDHLNHAFYEALNELGAKLAQIALQRPELFPTSVKESALIAA